MKPSRHGKALNHDFTNEFPEMADYILNDDPNMYTQLIYDELLKDRDRWLAKYQNQTERYQRLSDKYNKLLEEKLGLDGGRGSEGSGIINQVIGNRWERTSARKSCW